MHFNLEVATAETESFDTRWKPLQWCNYSRSTIVDATHAFTVLRGGGDCGH